MTIAPALELQEAGEALARLLACPPDVSAQVLGRGRLRSYAGEAAIVRQGDRLSITYILILGRAHALLYSADGQMVLLHELGPGDVFGALGEEDLARHDTDVVAVERVLALLLEGAEMAYLAQQHGCIGLALSRMLIRRLRRTTERMYERAAVSAAGRVYAELLRRARTAADLTIRPAPVVSELALRVATTRETASRAVNALERRGIIRRSADGLTVVAPRRLEEMIL